MAETGRDLLDVVGHQHQRRGVGVGGQIGQPRNKFLAAAEVEPGGGLVEQQQFGIGHQRSGDQDAFAFALRQCSVGAIEEMFGSHALEGVGRAVVVDLVVVLPPPAQDRVAGRYHHVAHQFIVRNTLGQRRTAQSHPLP